MQVALASTLIARESRFTRNRCNWDGCAIGLGDMAFYIEMTMGSETWTVAETNSM